MTSYALLWMVVVLLASSGVSALDELPMEYIGQYCLFLGGGIPEALSYGWDVYAFPGVEREMQCFEDEWIEVEIPEGYDEIYIAVVCDHAHIEWEMDFDGENWDAHGYLDHGMQCLRPTEGGFDIEELPYLEYVWFPDNLQRKYVYFRQPDDDDIDVKLDYCDDGWGSFRLLVLARGDSYGGPHESLNDCLIVGENYSEESEISSYLEGLGYTSEHSTSIPGIDRLSGFRLVLFTDDLIGINENTIRRYIENGGSVLLWGMQPTHLAMPEWIGMESTVSVSGSAVTISANRNAPFGNTMINEGDILCYRINQIQNALALTDANSAVVDACYYMDSDKAACLHNEFGAGRVAWTTAWPSPRNYGDDGYSTEWYESYLSSLYEWLISR